MSQHHSAEAAEVPVLGTSSELRIVCVGEADNAILLHAISQ